MSKLEWPEWKPKERTKEMYKQEFPEPAPLPELMPMITRRIGKPSIITYGHRQRKYKGY